MLQNSVNYLLSMNKSLIIKIIFEYSLQFQIDFPELCFDKNIYSINKNEVLIKMYRFCLNILYNWFRYQLIKIYYYLKVMILFWKVHSYQRILETHNVQEYNHNLQIHSSWILLLYTSNLIEAIKVLILCFF